MSRPRLLLLTPDFPPVHGGVQRLMAGVADHLTAFDVEVISFLAPHGSAGPHPTAARLTRRVPRLRRGHPLSVAALNAHALAVALRRPPAVVLSGHVVLAPACLALQRLRGVPFVQYVYAEEFRWRPGLSRRAMAAAERTVAISRATREQALAIGAPAARIALVPPGIDLPEPVERRPATPPTIVTVARLDVEHKGHDVLLRALPLVAREIPDVRWSVVGAGDPRRLLEAAHRAGLGDRLHVAVGVDDAERDRLLDAAAVFALPSRIPPGGAGGEGFGIVFLEAAARGLAVVGPDRGGPRDAFLDEVSGLAVDPEDHVALAAALIRLLRDPARAERMGEEGRRFAADHAWPAIARRLEAELRDVLAG